MSDQYKHDQRSMARDIADFHKKFGLEGPAAVTILDKDLITFRTKFLEEELKEFGEAVELDDVAGMADALVDLVYVAMGTAHLMGLPWERLWNEVHEANMRKERALKKEQSARGSEYDVVKPAGWKPPLIAHLLMRHVTDTNMKGTTAGKHVVRSLSGSMEVEVEKLEKSKEVPF